MRFAGVLLAAVLITPSCLNSGGQAGETRRIQIDYNHDEFSSAFFDYFPRSVEVHPGDTVVFKQIWSGEPHSVTMGTLVDKFFAFASRYVEDFRAGRPIPGEAPPEAKALMEPLPDMFTHNGADAAQNGAQPCFLDTGTAPQDPGTPCPQKKQPDFNGRQSYYNSGLIPYEGPGGNEYRVKLSSDVAPGRYNFYCNNHGPFMTGTIVVKPKSSSIPSQGEVDKQARSLIKHQAKPLLDAYRAALAGHAVFGKVPLTGPLAGYGTNLDSNGPSPGAILAFVPGTIEAKVGEKVTWTVVGFHTISFNVPPYFPIVSFGNEGTVTVNPKIGPPAGGSPKVPESGGDHQGPGPPPPFPVVDGGTWDGTGFFSSGGFGTDSFGQYSLRFSKPGTYRYACLVHPKMVGTVKVG